MFSIVTPLPFLLDFSFYAPLLLRVALGVYVLAIGFSAKHKVDAEMPAELSPLHVAYRAIFIAAGIALVIGLYTQIAAIAVALLMLAGITDQRARITTELNRAELSLLLIIALSLMMTGAGAFAFDLPL